MSNVTSVLAQVKALSEQEQQELLTQLEEYLVLGSQVTKEVKEMRFSKGKVCCHCNGADVVRNGMQDIYVEINIATAFYWRHKILNCISEFLGVGSVDGVVKADEIFFAYSYKPHK